MPNGDLKDTVKNLFPQRTDATVYDNALEKLESVAQGIQEVLGDPFVVRLEPGYRVDKGQQYKLAIRLDSPPFSDFLFRAYVPLDGFPVTLDLFGDKHPECADADALERELVQFLREDAVQRQIEALRRLKKTAG